MTRTIAQTLRRALGAAILAALAAAPAAAQSTGPDHAGYDPNAPVGQHVHEGELRGAHSGLQGVGYADPDLSHFNSMAYWMAGRPNAIPSTGAPAAATRSAADPPRLLWHL